MGSLILLSDKKVVSNADNFPSLQVALGYTGCDFVNSTITCPISGTVLTFSSSLNDEGDSTYFRGVGGSTAPVGSIVAPNTTDTVLISVYKTLRSQDVAFKYGDGFARFGISSVANGGGTAAGYVTAIGGGTDYGMYLNNTLSDTGTAADIANVCVISSAEWAADTAESWMYEHAGNVIKGGAATMAAGTIAAGMSQSSLDAESTPITITGDASSISAGHYIFHFPTGTPKNLKEIAMWMGHPDNHGFIHPSLIGY